MYAIRSIISKTQASGVARFGSATKLGWMPFRNVHIERRIEELKIELPPAPLPKANYNIVCKTDDTIYVSGHLPIKVRLRCLSIMAIMSYCSTIFFS